MRSQVRRREYRHAFNLARKARRRGDVASCERWLRHAERCLALEDRFQASIDKAKSRKADLIAKHAREREERTLKGKERYLHQLEDELEQIDAMAEADDQIAET